MAAKINSSSQLQSIYRNVIEIKRQTMQISDIDKEIQTLQIMSVLVRWKINDRVDR